MYDRAFKKTFLQRCPLRDREVFLNWAADTRTGGFRTAAYANIAAAKPARPEHILKVVQYLLDTDYKNNREAIRMRDYLDEEGVPPERRTAQQLLEVLTESADAHDPFLLGMGSVKNFFELIRDPLRNVRPCATQQEVREVTRWLFIDGGQRAAKKRLSEELAIKHGEEFVGTPLPEYSERLVEWWSQVPWSVTLAGDRLDTPCVMSIAAPTSDDRHEQIRSGRADMFRLSLEPGVVCSANLYVESMARSPYSADRVSSTSPMVHLFRAALCQQAMLSNLADLGEEQPLRILSLGCIEEFERWLRRFKYQPLGVVTPVAKLPLWERVVWDDMGLRESAELGVWRAIQRYFRRNGVPTV